MRSSAASTRPEPVRSSTASQTGAVRCSSTDVRRRKVSRSGVSCGRNSERMYSARNRSSPPETARSSSPAASAPRRIPAAQPSQRSSSSPPSSAANPASSARRSASPSRRLSASSPACSSSSLPSARSRAIGNPGVRRPTSASVDPAGTCSASVDSAFVALRERRRWALSTTSTKSSLELSREASRASSSVHSFRRRTAGLSAWPSSRSSATASCASRRATSSSASSTDSQATGRRSRSAHCAASVVFPYPAGAVSVTSDAEAVRRRFTSGVRDTAQGGGDGTRTFASTTFDGAARVRPELERGMPGSMRGRPSAYQSGRTTLAVGLAPVRAVAGGAVRK